MDRLCYVRVIHNKKYTEGYLRKSMLTNIYPWGYHKAYPMGVCPERMSRGLLRGMFQWLLQGMPQHLISCCFSEEEVIFLVLMSIY